MQKEEIWLLNEKYGGKKTVGFKKDFKRLQAGEPVDFVIGFKDFLGVKIDLSQKPLIPRPETEFWVNRALKKITSQPFGAAQGKTLCILDIFAGSGCIGIAVLKNIENGKVVFAEKDKAALKQIRANLKINSSLIRANKGYRKKRSIVARSDVFSNIKGKFDFIFANPPYIPDYRKNPSARLRAILRNRIQKSVLKYEPKQALFGGKDGLFYIRKFLKEAKNYLRPDSDGHPGGKIFMEFDSAQKKEVEALLKEYNYKKWEFHKDQFGKWRWIKI